MRPFFRTIGALLLVVGTVLALASAAGADAIGPITFESSQGYHVGDINAQPIPGSLPNGGWSKLGPYDAQVVLVSAYSPHASGYGFGSQALRISDALTSESFWRPDVLAGSRG